MEYFFDNVLKSYINKNQYYSICEIGANKGGNTDKLLSLKKVSLTVIDPCIKTDLPDKYKNFDNIKIYKDLSLNILPKLSKPFDCILIDGDHNWYTVYNELKIIEEKKLIRNGGTIFLHDVCWPYGRRDMYYDPKTIPSQFIHPYAKKGIIKGQSELSDSPKSQSKKMNNALQEGGSKNGVLTAVEDFLKNNKNQYSFYHINEQYGLGVLLKSNNPVTNIEFIKLYLKIIVKNNTKKYFPFLYYPLKKMIK